MTDQLEVKSNERKEDLINLFVLISLAAIIGIYLVVTTVVLSRDGVHYIGNAQQFLSDPIGAIRMYYPGHPFLIMVAYKFVMLFKSSSSIFTWIYAAQGITLLCRLLALIPLYFIGKILVGSRKSFWAIFIIVVLPYPAQFGSGALREWPHILFLGTGFLLLLIGAREEKWWMFGVVGVISGIGHTIRPECIQLMVYGITWLMVRMMWPRNNTHRLKYFQSLIVLLIGFLMVIIPYAKVRGKILPDKLENIINSSSNALSGQNKDIRPVLAGQKNVDGSSFAKISKALMRLSEEICDNLMYFFVLPVLLGVYHTFRKNPRPKKVESFFGFLFIVTNVILMVLLHSNYGYISRRHCLPLAVSLVFYAPMGLMLLGDWVSDKCPKDCFGVNWSPRFCFFALVVLGVVICLPKLLRPIRIEKKAFRTVAEWVRENTSPEEVIGISDSAKRIGFYADRANKLIVDNFVPNDVKYVIDRFKKNKDRPLYYNEMEEKFTPIKQWEMGNSVTVFYFLKK